MRKAVLVGLVLVFLATLPVMGGLGQYFTRSLGGTETIELPPGQKLEMVTWKESNLWLQTRQRRQGEAPEKHDFSEYSPMGVLQGKVVIQEH